MVAVVNASKAKAVIAAFESADATALLLGTVGAAQAGPQLRYRGHPDLAR
jgi:hypothetical protein